MTVAGSAAPAALVPAPWRLGHVRALDGVRGLAILTVVLYHAGLPIDGYLGVDVFFVLSGFLITSLLLGEHATTGRVRLASFYRRRALRLLPALAVMLVAGVVYAAVSGDAKTMRSIPYAAGYVVNWAVALGRLGPTDSIIGHTWSLAIEEQFYLVWPPVLLVLLARGGRRAAGIGAVGLALASAVLRAGLWDGDNLARVYFGADAHADGILIGCAAAVLVSMRRGSVRLPRGIVGAAGFVVAAAFIGKQVGGHAFVSLLVGGGWTVFALAVAVLIVHVATSPSSALAVALSRPWLVVLGTVSYGLYLWHTPLFAIAHDAGTPKTVGLLLMFVATPLATWASYRFVEAPFLRLKNRQGHTGVRGRRDLHPDRAGHRGHRLSAMAGQAAAS